MVGQTTFNGHTVSTTFEEDFMIAEAFGKKAIMETYKNALKLAKININYTIDLALSLNWRSWSANKEYTELYVELYTKFNDSVYEKADKDEISREDLSKYMWALD